MANLSYKSTSLQCNDYRWYQSQQTIERRSRETLQRQCRRNGHRSIRDEQYAQPQILPNNKKNGQKEAKNSHPAPQSSKASSRKFTNEQELEDWLISTQIPKTRIMYSLSTVAAKCKCKSHRLNQTSQHDRPRTFPLAAGNIRSGIPQDRHMSSDIAGFPHQCFLVRRPSSGFGRWVGECLFLSRDLGVGCLW